MTGYVYAQMTVWSPARVDPRELAAAEAHLAQATAFQDDLQQLAGGTDTADRFRALADELRVSRKAGGPATASLLPFAVVAQALAERLFTAVASVGHLGAMTAALEDGLDPYRGSTASEPAEPAPSPVLEGLPEGQHPWY